MTRRGQRGQPAVETVMTSLSTTLLCIFLFENVWKVKCFKMFQGYLAPLNQHILSCVLCGCHVFEGVKQLALPDLMVDFKTLEMMQVSKSNLYLALSESYSTQRRLHTEPWPKPWDVNGHLILVRLGTIHKESVERSWLCVRAIRVSAISILSSDNGNVSYPLSFVPPIWASSIMFWMITNSNT